MQPLKLSFLTWICKDPTYWLAANNKTYNVIMKLTVVVNMNIVQHGGGKPQSNFSGALAEESKSVKMPMCIMFHYLYPNSLV